MMEVPFGIFVFCVIVTLCMSEDLSENIKGGRPARNGDFSFAVRITKNDEFVCSGMLVSRSWVLTRKGCIENEVGDYKIVFSSRVTRQVRYIQTDKKYDEIILARLNKRVQRTKDNVRPFDRFIWKGGEKQVTDCKTIGFSSDQIALKEIGTKMKWTKKCGQFNKAVSFCFDANQGSICAEDNGSPIICKSGRSNDNKWYLVGLTSVEKGCQDSNTEGIRLTYFKKYIFKVLRGKGGNGGGNEGGNTKKEDLEPGEECDANEQCQSLRCDVVCKNNCSQGNYYFNKTCTACPDAQDCAGIRPIVRGTCIICPLGGPECPTRSLSLSGYDVDIYNKDQCEGIKIPAFLARSQIDCYQQTIDGVMPAALTYNNNVCIAYPRICRLRLFKSGGKNMVVKRCTG